MVSSRGTLVNKESKSKDAVNIYPRDIDKFKKLNVKPGKEPTFILKHEDKVASF